MVCPINPYFKISTLCQRYCEEYPMGKCPIIKIEAIIKERKENDTRTDRPVSVS